MLEIIDIKIALKNADQKPWMLNESVKRSVIKSIAVLTTKSDKPKVKNARGIVKTFNNVPKVAFTKAKTKAIIK